jgi:hypothetical protein
LAACSLHFEECLPTSVVIVLEYKDKLLKNFLAAGFGTENQQWIIQNNPLSLF